MPVQKILWLALLAGLYGCQPETPAQTTPLPSDKLPAGESSATFPVSAVVPVSQVASVTEPEVISPAAESAIIPAREALPSPPKKVIAPTVNKPVIKAAEQPADPVVAAPPPVAVTTPPVAELVRPEIKASDVVPPVDALSLAKKNNCLACHALDKKVVGPAWRDVAAKYRGDAGALPRLAAKIGKGGSGVWGSMAMPPQPQLSEADRTTLARFVLNLQ